MKKISHGTDAATFLPQLCFYPFRERQQNGRCIYAVSKAADYQMKFSSVIKDELLQSDIGALITSMGF